MSVIAFKKAKGIKNTREDKIGYLLIAPFSIFFFIFVFLPILLNIYYSLTNYDLRQSKFIGLLNYKNLLTDSVFFTSLGNTFLYAIVTLVFSTAIGLLVAILFNGKVFGSSIFRTVFFLPYVTSMVSVSMIWLWMFDPSNGVINIILKLMHIKAQNWLFDKNEAMACIIIISVWKYIGYNMVIYLAGLQGISHELYEAAKIDGANVWEQFRFITYPLLKPVTFFLVTTGFINNFNVFELVNILTNGGPMNSTTTIVHQIYIRAFSDYLVGYSSAISVVLMAIVIIVTAINYKINTEKL